MFTIEIHSALLWFSSVTHFFLYFRDKTYDLHL